MRQCAYLGSNQGPPACEAGALPLSYTRRAPIVSHGCVYPLPPVPLDLPLPLPAAPPPLVRPAAVVIGGLGGTGSSIGRRVLARRPGGLLLFGELRDGGGALRRALRASNLRPVVMVDQEGGAVRRVRALGPPSARELRQFPVWRLQREHRVAARGLRRLGVHVNLAPVADVDRGGATGFRALGATPGTAGRRVAAAVRGLASGGVEGCVKHYPGLGSVGTNTDWGVAVDRRSRTTVLRDLQAFRPAILAGVRCVMVSSVVVPALCSKPAVLCPSTYRRLRRLGFDGAIITDSLDADALRPYGSPGAVAVKALAAGADGVLVASPWSTLQVIDDVTRATRSGRLDRARLAASAQRLRALR